jgi:hypothetical protein
MVHESPNLLVGSLQCALLLMDQLQQASQLTLQALDLMCPARANLPALCMQGPVSMTSPKI